MWKALALQREVIPVEGSYSCFNGCPCPPLCRAFLIFPLCTLELIAMLSLSQAASQIEAFSFYNGVEKIEQRHLLFPELELQHQTEEWVHSDVWGLCEMVPGEGCVLSLAQRREDHRGWMTLLLALCRAGTFSLSLSSNVTSKEKLFLTVPPKQVPSLVILHSPLLHSCPQSIRSTEVKLCGYLQSSLARGLRIRLYRQEALAAGRRLRGEGVGLFLISFLSMLDHGAGCGYIPQQQSCPVTLPPELPLSVDSGYSFLLLPLDCSSLPLLVSGTKIALVVSVSAVHTPGSISSLIFLHLNHLNGILFVVRIPNRFPQLVTILTL